jgi:hypothetical protein
MFRLIAYLQITLSNFAATIIKKILLIAALNFVKIGICLNVL